MNRQTTAIISTLLVLFVTVKNAMEPYKSTWNYAMIALGIAILIYNGYQFLQRRKGCWFFRQSLKNQQHPPFFASEASKKILTI
jgi:hypothetical protein